MAGLNIFERQVGDFTVFDLSGDITFGEGSIVLRNAIRRALSESKKKFLLNFSGVGYVDSSGVGELVSGFTAINREGGQLRLSNLPQRIKEALLQKPTFPQAFATSLSTFRTNYNLARIRTLFLTRTLIESARKYYALEFCKGLR